MIVIAVECYPDEALIKSLGFKARHFSGKGRVLKAIEKEKVLTGIVDFDEDKSWPSKWVKDRKKLFGRVIVMKRKKARVIALNPRLEDFIVWAAKASNMKLESYCLPSDPRKLHKRISSKRRDEKYESLLRDLAREKPLVELKKIIEELIEGLL